MRSRILKKLIDEQAADDNYPIVEPFIIDPTLKPFSRFLEIAYQEQDPEKRAKILKRQELKRACFILRISKLSNTKIGHLFNINRKTVKVFIDEGLDLYPYIKLP